MKKLMPILSVLLALTLPFLTLAQGTGEAGFDGKYKVFVYVALMVLLGIFLYLIRLDRKIARVEKRIEEEL